MYLKMASYSLSVLCVLEVYFQLLEDLSPTFCIALGHFRAVYGAGAFSWLWAISGQETFSWGLNDLVYPLPHVMYHKNHVEAVIIQKLCKRDFLG